MEIKHNCISYHINNPISQYFRPIFGDHRILMFMFDENVAELVNTLEQLIPGTVLMVHHILNVMVTSHVFTKSDKLQ